MSTTVCLVCQAWCGPAHTHAHAQGQPTHRSSGSIRVQHVCSWVDDGGKEDVEGGQGDHCGRKHQLLGQLGHLQVLRDSVSGLNYVQEDLDALHVAAIWLRKAQDQDSWRDWVHQLLTYAQHQAGTVWLTD